MENTNNQRDSFQALQWASITGLMTALLSFTFLIVVETILFKFLNVIDTKVNNLQLFTLYLSHASHISFLTLSGINNLSLNRLNEILQENNTILIGEYIIYILALIPAVLAYLSEYKSQMVNVRFISGVQYFKGAEAVVNLKKYMGKVEDDAVKIAGIPISHDRTTKHIAVLGKTGGGKTVALLPIMRAAIERGDKVILFDNKSDFTRLLNDKNGNGNCPVIVAPWDARSAAWDVAKDCRTRAEAAELAVKFIGESSDPMWSEGARSILTGFIHKLQVEKQETWTWKDLGDLIAITTMNDVEALMEKYHPEGKRSVESIKNAVGESEGAGKTTQSLLITLSSQISPIYRMGEAWDGVEEKFSVRDFLDDKLKSKVVILQGNAALMGIQNAYIGGIIAMLSGRVNSPDYAERPASAPGLWLFFDECPQLGKLPELKPFLEIGRSKGVRVVMGFQNPSQLKELYDKDGADSMLDIFQSYIFCMLGSEAADWASNSVGKQIIERFKPSTSTNSGSGGGGSSSASWDRQEDAAIRPVDFTQGLGVDKEAGGVWALYWPTGGDIYKLLFKFSDAPELRPGTVKALWTLPEWDRPAQQKTITAVKTERPDAEEKPLTILFKDFGSFLISDFSTPTTEPEKTLYVDLADENGIITHEDHTEAPNTEEVDDMEDDFDLPPEMED